MTLGMTEVAADPVVEARRLLMAAHSEALRLRAAGGVAIALIAPTIGRLQPRRSYHDIDFVAPAGTPAVSRLMTDLGYEGARRFNTMNGSERLLFHDPNGRRVDVFIDTLRMCHVLPLRSRLALHDWTLTPADLLLSKLQIVEMTDRDAQDLLALFADLAVSESDANGPADAISLRRIREVCDDDWGWWRTVDENLGRLVERWTAAVAVAGRDDILVLDTARERAGGVRAALAKGPRSLRWKARAAVGTRMRWYDLPEEVR
jgi:hypothetical protein